MENNRSKQLFSILLLIFTCLILTKSQEDMYASILKEGKKTQDVGVGVGVTNQEKKFENIPIAPKVELRFSCDPDIKINTVRQDVMNSSNYIK